ncbi:Spindle assembly abnormal protein 6 [Rhizoclosmatium sp. JEL0117]|nr:Spindle assembly abnormal protein 6 [Rhizoclosmatium sp. JEL0117]
MTSRRVPVFVGDAGTPLAVEVAFSTSEGAVSARLTSAADVFFVFEAVVQRNDFDALRKRQHLLVAFDALEDMALALLDQCSKDPTRFQARLSVSQSHEPSVLQIIETNAFKHITHLALDFVQANDNAIKQHLAALVDHFSKESKLLATKLMDTEADMSAKLRAQESSAHALSLELESLKISHAEQASRLELQHSIQLSKERDAFLKEKDGLKDGFEKERRALVDRYEEKIRSISSTSTSLQTTTSQLEARIAHLDHALSSLQNKHHHLEQEYSTAKHDLAAGKQTNHHLSIQNSDLERTVDGLRKRVGDLERISSEREDSVRRLEKERVERESMKGRLEEALEECQRQKEGLEEGFRTATEEINKGNEIIRKIQADLKSAKSKIKLKNVVALQQEKLLDERASIIEMHEKELESLKGTVGRMQKEAEEYKTRIEELNKSVEEGKKIIGENTHVIEWLHKQLNEEALNKPGLGGYGRLDFDKYGSTTARDVPISSSAPNQATGGILSGLREMHLNEPAINNNNTNNTSPAAANKYTPIRGVSPHRAATAGAAFINKKISPVRDTSSLNLAGKSANATAAAVSHLFKENLYTGRVGGGVGVGQQTGTTAVKKSNYF